MLDKAEPEATDGGGGLSSSGVASPSAKFKLLEVGTFFTSSSEILLCDKIFSFYVTVPQ